MADKSEGRFAYEGIDRVIHEKARLSIVASLASHPEGLLFTDLKDLCTLTDGNLSRHLTVLQDAGVVDVKKGILNNRPMTTCKLTATGRKRFTDYVSQLERVISDAVKIETRGHGSGALSRTLNPLEMLNAINGTGNFLNPNFAIQSNSSGKRGEKMKIIEADAMGMCFGVRDALAAMRHVEKPMDVTVLGQLVHNPLVTRELAGRGFATLDESARSTLAVQTSAVLITAHGISHRERSRLIAQGKTLVDTTCPLVRKAHRAAIDLSNDGHFVIVVGKKDHVEVRGLTGDLNEGQFAVVETCMEVRPYQAQRLGIVAQTTTPEREARAIVERIKTLNPSAEVRFINTICQPTRDRQAALERLLEQVDVLVVVGGHHSNNTRQLAAHAREKGVRALHVEDAAELQPEMFAPHDRVGLTAGTSTLPETIARVRRRLEGFHVHHCSTVFTVARCA